MALARWVGISGKLLEHAVLSLKEIEYAMAYFMRNNVHEWANVSSKPIGCIPNTMSNIE